MSNTAQRAALVAAADGVTASDFTVHCHTTRPSAPQPGDAWVRWRGAERGDGFLFINTWALFVVLGPDENIADDMADTLGYALADVLEPIAFVEGILPVALATSAGDMNGIQITGRSE
jgi:hypothetical protein